MSTRNTFRFILTNLIDFECSSRAKSNYWCGLPCLYGYVGNKHRNYYNTRRYVWCVVCSSRSRQHTAWWVRVPLRSALNLFWGESMQYRIQQFTLSKNR